MLPLLPRAAMVLSVASALYAETGFGPLLTVAMLAGWVVLRALEEAAR